MEVLNDINTVWKQKLDFEEAGIHLKATEIFVPAAKWMNSVTVVEEGGLLEGQVRDILPQRKFYLCGHYQSITWCWHNQIG